MKNSIGGRLQGISLDAFLQMAQMEEITCTLSVTSGDRTGQLFLLDGKLISAETEQYTNLEAAQHIISWETAVIDIIESCSKTVDEIKQPLMNILMDAMRLRDEAKSNPPPKPKPSEKPEAKPAPPAPAKAAAAPNKSKAPEKQPDSGGKPAENAGKKPASAKAGTKTAKKGEKKPGAANAGAESRPKAPGKPFPWKIVAAGLAVLIVGGGLVTFLLSGAKRDRLAYEAFVLSVREADAADRKLDLLNAYMRENPDSPHSEEVIQQIKSLMTELDEKEFNTVEQTASQFATEGALKKAAGVYEKYLEENGESPFAGNASAALKNLSVRMENRAYEEMLAEAKTLGPERISLYRDFLQKYPGSNHRQEVLSLISAMEDEFFIYVERKIQENEKEMNWGACTEFSQQYLAIYPESAHAEAVTKWLVLHRDKYQASQSFEQLQKRAERCGEDHDAALAVFSDYLKAYPGTPVREKIEGEIERLRALSEGKRLANATARMVQQVLEAGSRFSVKDEKTVLDTRTGLMWCLLDSQVTENRCLTYEDATEYVSSLETGGHDDWRLPSPDELKALYGKTPAFPFDPDTWYWSSKTEKRYDSQWIIDVQVIDPGNPDGQDDLMRESWKCGIVRAVRPNR